MAVAAGLPADDAIAVFLHASASHQLQPSASLSRAASLDLVRVHVWARSQQCMHMYAWLHACTLRAATRPALPRCRACPQAAGTVLSSITSDASEQQPGQRPPLHNPFAQPAAAAGGDKPLLQ